MWMGKLKYSSKMLAATALLTGAVSLSSVAGAQSLVEALAAAYATNPELLAARAQLKSTDESVPQALANWRPDVSLSGDVEREHTHLNTRTANRDQIRSPRNATLQVTQPLFRGFRTVAGVANAENSVLSQRATLLAKEQTVLLDAVTAYLAVVRDQAVLDLNINNEQVLRRQLEATQDRFRVGEITRTDVSQAEARVAGARADRIQAAGNLKTSNANFANIIGQPPGKLTSPKPLDDLAKSEDEAVELAKSNHPDVIAATFNQKAADDSIKSKRGELYPTLNLVGTLSRFWETTSNDSQISTGEVRLDLTVPIYQKGSVYSELREAKIGAGKSRLDLEDARRDAVNDAQSTWEGLQTAQVRTKSFAAQIEAAEIALEGVQREASVGSRTVLDVLDAEQELLDAKVNLVRAQRDEIVASYQLKEATGQLTARELSLPVEIYDPTAYYGSVRNKLFGAELPQSAAPAKK